MLCLSRKNIGRDVKMQDLTPWAFEETSISGSQLLFRSGVWVDSSSSGYGVSIYGIDGEGSAAEWNNGTSSWAYWHMRGGWVFSPVGASSFSVRQGDVDGWAYGAQTSPSMPPSLSFDQIYRETYGEPQTAAPVTAAPTNGETTAPAGTTETGNTTAQTETQSAVFASAVKAKPPATSTAKAKTKPKATRGTASNKARDYIWFGVLIGALALLGAYFYRRNHAPDPKLTPKT